jgi:hypothetical protein
MQIHCCTTLDIARHQKELEGAFPARANPENFFGPWVGYRFALSAAYRRLTLGGKGRNSTEATLGSARMAAYSEAMSAASTKTSA